MHLLLLNDDGIAAIGLKTLADEAIRAGHTVSIAAPDRQRSCASHSMTISAPLEARRVPYEGAREAYAIDGVPADCARLGLYLVPDADFVLSGINEGPNLGTACLYSGTVGGAAEASLRGYSAMAVSLNRFGATDYTAAARWTMRLLDTVASHPLPRGEIYNLNVPDLPYHEIKGLRSATLGRCYFDPPCYIQTEDGRYLYKTGADIEEDDPSADLTVIREGFATLSVLTWNLLSAVALPFDCETV